MGKAMINEVKVGRLMSACAMPGSLMAPSSLPPEPSEQCGTLMVIAVKPEALQRGDVVGWRQLQKPKTSSTCLQLDLRVFPPCLASVTFVNEG